MPDISMCLNITCPLKETCYRFKATPNEYKQSYAGFKPKEDGTCDYYEHIEPKEKD